MAKKNTQKPGIFRSAYSSLHLLCSQEGEREKVISLIFFSFLLQQILFSVSTATQLL